DPTHYDFHGSGPSAEYSEILGGEEDAPQSTALEPAVTMSVAKRKGTNAIHVEHRVMEQVEELPAKVVTREVTLTVSRNYGETAAEKSNELLYHMALAILSVTLLVALALGWRESGAVALAIPVTLGLTLVVFYFFGYTLNRVTLFALIF